MIEEIADDSFGVSAKLSEDKKSIRFAGYVSTELIGDLRVIMGLNPDEALAEIIGVATVEKINEEYRKLRDEANQN